MPLRVMTVSAIATGLLATLTLTGCTGGGSDQPHLETVPPATSGAVTSTATSVGQSTSADPATSVLDEREVADRAAVEQAFAKFRFVYEGALDQPSSRWPALIGSVAVDPKRAQLLKALAGFKEKGIKFYGHSIRHPYWTNPIAGKDVAVMGDCGDYSKYGKMWVDTGKHDTEGVVRDNTEATLVRGADGVWRVKRFVDLGSLPC